MKTIGRLIVGILVYIGSLFACVFGTNMAVEAVADMSEEKKKNKKAKADKLLEEADVEEASEE